MGGGKILAANPPDFCNIGGYSGDDISHPVGFLVPSWRWSSVDFLGLTFFKIYYIDVSPKALSPKAASTVVLISAALWLLLVRPTTKSRTFVIAATRWGGRNTISFSPSGAGPPSA